MLGLVILEDRLSNIQIRIPIFSMATFLGFASAPFNLVSAKALITKIYPAESQGYIQGVFGSITKLGLVLGPIVSSISFHHRTIYGTIQIVLTIISIVALQIYTPIYRHKEDSLADRKANEEK